MLQPAKLFVFITVIIDVFVWSTAFYKITYSNIIKNTENQLLILGGISLLFLVYYYILGKSLKWFLSSGKVGELTEEVINKQNSSILVATFVLWQVSVALMFSPTEIFGRSLMLSVTAYVVLNILSKYLSHKIDKTVYLKSFIMIFIAYVLVYLL